jgi:hypothetical protein
MTTMRDQRFRMARMRRSRRSVATRCRAESFSVRVAFGETCSEAMAGTFVSREAIALQIEE